jgi:hypothetical protein
MNAAIPASGNKTWGFWGTMGGHASVAWPLAVQAVAAATGENFDAVRAFLDSRYGRHFADEVHNGLFAGFALPEAIAAATRKWMDRKISRQTEWEYGIPRGLSYLTGFVLHCGILPQEERAD